MIDNRDENDLKILIFEWLIGGGLWADNLVPEQAGDLLSQGRQMLIDLCADFQAAGFDVVAPVDIRFNPKIAARKVTIAGSNGLRSTLSQLAKAADRILVVAPESNGCLQRCLTWLNEYREKWLNPNLKFTELTANKNQLQDFLFARGVSVPAGKSVQQWMSSTPNESKSYGSAAFVLKRSDGCGGEEMKLVNRNGIHKALNDLRQHERAGWRIEEFVPGIAVSVSAILHGDRHQVFPPLRQVFQQKPIGPFSHCVDDLNDDIKFRAIQIALRTIEALPKTTGFVGIDCVIGKRDVVIEVNPRITVSYSVLRTQLDSNLAEQMLALTDGQLKNNQGVPW